jgi:hypothetical protein
MRARNAIPPLTIPTMSPVLSPDDDGDDGDDGDDDDDDDDDDDGDDDDGDDDDDSQVVLPHPAWMKWDSERALVVPRLVQSWYTTCADISRSVQPHCL